MKGNDNDELVMLANKGANIKCDLLAPKKETKGEIPNTENANGPKAFV